MTHATSEDRRPWWRSPRATGLVAISLGTIGLAQRDIHHRGSSEIRGSKVLWRLVSLNAIGALAYLVWGRTKSTVKN